MLGQALGQYGINIMNFCNKFNEQTKNIKQGTIVPVKLIVYNQTSFEIEIKTPSTVDLLKKVSGIKKGSSTAKKSSIGFILLQEIYHLVHFKRCSKKLHHLKAVSLSRSVVGTAISMGLSVPSV